MILKVVESDLEIRQETRSRLVSFALMGADPKSLLGLLGELRKARDNDTRGILVDMMEENRDAFLPDRISIVDERNITIQITSALSALKLEGICDWMEWYIAKDDGTFDRALARSVYIGAIAAISIHVIGLNLSESKMQCFENHSYIDSIGKLLHIDIAALCFFGSKCIAALMAHENQVEILSRLAPIMHHAGSSLVATSDQNRVALLHDKDAQDLWATGDAHAQKRALLQLADKIAASQIGKYGIINSLSPFSDGDGLEIGTPELSDLYLLADRCGADIEQLEDVFVKGVLYRHGSTEAFSNSWHKTYTQRPLFGLKLVVPFFMECDDMSNFEVLRVTEMVTQCLHSSSSSNDDIRELEPVFRKIYDICVPHVAEEWAHVRILLLPMFQVLADVLYQEPSDGQKSDIVEWVISVSCESNVHDMFDMIRTLMLEYRAMRHHLNSVDSNLPIDYPVDASLVVFSTLLKIVPATSGENINATKVFNLLEMLDMRSDVTFGLLLLDPMTMDSMPIPQLKEFARSFKADALHHMLKIVVEFLRHKEVPDEATKDLKAELLYKNALMILQSKLAAHISGDVLSQIASAVVSNANSDEVISRIQNIMRTFVYMGKAYKSDIGEMVSLIVTLCDDPTIDAHAIMTGMYLDSLDMCLSALEKDSSYNGDISTGEAIQNIFGIVRSLDDTPVTGRDIVDPTPLRSAVYDRIGNYLASFSGHNDIIKSEIQIQLVEMMASLGRDKWNDWEPPSTGFDWSLQGESLLHSRLFSHFSTEWPDALESSSICPEDLATVESVNEAVIAMSKNASTAPQAFSLWTAISSILLPHFLTTDNIENKLHDSYSATLTRIIELRDFNNMLFALDEYVGRFGQPGKELEEAAIDASEPRDQPLIRMLIGMNSDIHGDILAGMLHFMQSSDVPDSYKLAAIVLAIKNNTVSAILDQSDFTLLQSICCIISGASEFGETLQCTSDDNGQSFECPIRALVCSALISHLLHSQHENEAFCVAFETVGLCRALRVKDSGQPITRAFLSRIRHMRWSGAYADLAGVLQIPACSALAALIHEVPLRCAEVLP